MTETPTTPALGSCAALLIGDEIEAWHDGRLIDVGRVSRILPTMGMVWIVCARTGTQKLVDIQTSTVVRVEAAVSRRSRFLADRGSSNAHCVSAGRSETPPPSLSRSCEVLRSVPVCASPNSP